MAKYTLELRQLIDNNIEIFDFNYPFFAPGQKNAWEEKFINYYYFHEIGAETVDRWKHQLKSRLNMIYPKYLELYKTILATEGIDFLRNKDLVETFERELSNNSLAASTQNTSSNENSNTQNESITSGSNNTTQSNTLNSSNNSIENRQSSNLDNGLASVSLNVDSITGVEKNTNDETSTESNNTTQNIENKNNIQGSTSGQTATIGEQNNNNKVDSTTKEKTTLKSLGNIGVTSSAELLEKWRKIIIDLQKDMIEDCHDLFMLVY